MHYLRWDLGPYRQWEAEQIDAHEWRIAEQVQAAWRAGIADAEAERKTESVTGR